jgi:hypothetical protein
MLVIGMKREGVLALLWALIPTPDTILGCRITLGIDSNLVCDSNESQRVPFQVSAKSELS